MTRRAITRRNLAVLAVAVVIGALGLIVGGGWGIVILEAGAASVVVALVILHLRNGDGDAAG